MSRYIIPLYDLGRKLYKDVSEFNSLVGQENVPDIGMKVYTEVCSQIVHAIGSLPRHTESPALNMVIAELMCIPMWTTLVYTQTPNFPIIGNDPRLRRFADIVRTFGLAFFKIIDDKIGFNPNYHYFAEQIDLDKMLILASYDAAIFDNPPLG